MTKRNPPPTPAEEIIAMIHDVHWQYQKRINEFCGVRPGPGKPDREAEAALLTLLLQHYQIHRFLDVTQHGPDNQIRNWSITRSDVHLAGDRVMTLMAMMRDDPTAVHRLGDALAPKLMQKLREH